MSDWTVVGLYDRINSSLYVAAVFPGDVASTAVTPAMDGLQPMIRVVDAATGPEAAYALQGHLEGWEAMPAAETCRSCRNWDGDELAFRDAFGHDMTGHRLANTMKREGYGDRRSFLAADLSALDGLRGMGATSRARVRQARRRLRSAPGGRTMRLS
ncbi:hypothetical protein FM076_01060 [Streptomyces albus subsp. chlorinus]|uniref:hypothetical protein n=1 Tax=Streptomyces albus TaxID=1888 RepID=UPI00156F9B9A|nr:hypothetical protein [Streptomyces albus]NSC19874.1 hypothetical protein [Streptomyces albus subsp. chlorinus]